MLKVHYATYLQAYKQTHMKYMQYMYKIQEIVVLKVVTWVLDVLWSHMLFTFVKIWEKQFKKI